jgi:hypothetical protein
MSISSSYLPDNGCNCARQYLGVSTMTCLNDCPFSDCITDLKPTEIPIILKKQAIEGILNCADKGMGTKDIAFWFNTVSERQIRLWIKNRVKITNKLNRYAPVGV